MNKKTIYGIFIVITLTIVGVLIFFFADNQTKQEARKQDALQKQQEAEAMQRQEKRREKLIEVGVKAIIHTIVLAVEKDILKVREIYPYKDESGKTYPVQDLTLQMNDKTTFYKRSYIYDEQGNVVNAKDDPGSFEEIKPDFFVSATILDDPYAAKVSTALTVVYFDEFPGMKTATEQKTSGGVTEMPRAVPNPAPLK
ncbi:MAG: hypothetical protein AAB400_05455 [Patescibacteria group bacterium]